MIKHIWQADSDPQVQTGGQRVRGSGGRGGRGEESENKALVCHITSRRFSDVCGDSESLFRTGLKQHTHILIPKFIPKTQ